MMPLLGWGLCRAGGLGHIVVICKKMGMETGKWLKTQLLILSVIFDVSKCDVYHYHLDMKVLVYILLFLIWRC